MQWAAFTHLRSTRNWSPRCRRHRKTCQQRTQPQHRSTVNTFINSQGKRQLLWGSTYTSAEQRLFVAAASHLLLEEAQVPLAHDELLLSDTRVHLEDAPHHLYGHHGSVTTPRTKAFHVLEAPLRQNTAGTQHGHAEVDHKVHNTSSAGPERIARHVPAPNRRRAVCTSVGGWGTRWQGMQRVCVCVCAQRSKHHITGRSITSPTRSSTDTQYHLAGLFSTHGNRLQF
jgi:hypothetical protein